jgi:hypothetical protein
MTRLALARLALAAATAAIAGPALAADLTFTNPAGSTATFYGQINLTYQGLDDGVTTHDSFVDNSNSASRVGLWLDFTPDGNALRFNFEAALGIEGTSDTSQTGGASWIDWQRQDIRKLELSYAAGFGRLWVGQGSMATDGAAEIDRSGTSVVGYVNLPDTAGSFEFRDGTALSGIAISDVFKDFDGPRRFRLRYDTPDQAGFTLSVAYGQDVLAEDDDASYYDAALRYGLENTTVALEAAIGYNWKDDDGAMTEQLVASASLRHLPSGLNLTLAAGDQRSGEASYVYTKLGWSGDLFAPGQTALSVDYYAGADFEVAGSESTSWGVQAVQGFTDLGLEAYLGYRVFELDGIAGADFHDMQALLVGARWKF